MNIAVRGLKPIVIWFALSVLALFLWPWALVVFVPLLALTTWFYRDPPRRTPRGEHLLVAPADGKVIEVVEANHPYCGTTTKIGIFMNAFNVHVNRMASAGTVEYMLYVPGRKWIASADKASQDNERFYLGYRSSHGPTVICQIAGLLARRIVCSARKGQSFRAGQRFGMILLGSKVDLYLPAGAVPTVRVGDVTRAGETVVAEVKK